MSLWTGSVNWLCEMSLWTVSMNWLYELFLWTGSVNCFYELALWTVSMNWLYELFLWTGSMNWFYVVCFFLQSSKATFSYRKRLYTENKTEQISLLLTLMLSRISWIYLKKYYKFKFPTYKRGRALCWREHCVNMSEHLRKFFYIPLDFLFWT